MRVLIFIEIIVAVFLLGSCKENLLVEHTNKFDPLSPDYTPVSPEVVSAVTNDDYLEISWVDKSIGTQGFFISKGFDQRVIDTIPVFSNRPHSEYVYRDSFNVKPGIYYYYGVKAYNRYNQSPSITFKINATLAYPIITRVSTISPNSAIINWYNNPSTLKITKRILERKDNSGGNNDFAIRAELDTALTSFNDTNLDTNIIYHYRMCSLSKYFKTIYSIVKKINYENGQWKFYYK